MQQEKCPGPVFFDINFIFNWRGSWTYLALGKYFWLSFWTWFEDGDSYVAYAEYYKCSSSQFLSLKTANAILEVLFESMWGDLFYIVADKMPTGSDTVKTEAPFLWYLFQWYMHHKGQ